MRSTFSFIAFFLLGCMAGTLVFFFYFWIKPTEVVVPDVTSMDIAQAEGILRGAGLKIGQIHGEGRVSFTVPAAKTRVKKGRTVNVFCEEPQNLSVPNLIGSPRETAEIILQNMGFKVRIVQMPFKGSDGRVMGVYPPPGTEMKKGDEVSILIDVGEPGRD
ncbi:PASTA domain-containing protein [Pseudothermotoga sp.]|uniref:PASTA domain-containing protein n=1 Tax=Pseudothermotoga sp. TaxID=2033661 RepID=UPI0031F614AB